MVKSRNLSCLSDLLASIERSGGVPPSEKYLQCTWLIELQIGHWWGRFTILKRV